MTDRILLTCKWQKSMHLSFDFFSHHNSIIVWVYFVHCSDEKNAGCIELICEHLYCNKIIIQSLPSKYSIMTFKFVVLVIFRLKFKPVLHHSVWTITCIYVYEESVNFSSDLCIWLFVCTFFQCKCNDCKLLKE